MYSGTVQQHMPDSVTAVATEGTVCMYVCMYVCTAPYSYLENSLLFREDEQVLLHCTYIYRLSTLVSYLVDRLTGW